MDNRLALADAALKAGRSEEGVEHLIAALNADPARASHVYRALLVQLYRLGRYAEGADWSARALERYPRDFDIWNTRGVLLRKAQRYAEALEALDQAIKLDSRHTSPQVNRGNVLLDLKQGAKAEAVFVKLLRKEPRNAEYMRQQGRALLQQGKREPALLRLRQAIAIKKDFIDAWLDLAGALNEQERYAEAEEATDRALAANPDHPKLLEAKSVVIRRSGQLRRAEAYLLELLPRFETAGWLHYQLGGALTEIDRERANPHLRRAIELDPSRVDYLLALIESLDRTRTGDEGANIEEAYRLTKSVLAMDPKGLGSGHSKILFEVLVRVCAFDEMAALGDFRTLGRSWAESGRHTALLKQLAQVKTLDDRYELLEQHRIWGRDVEATAAQQPLRRPPPRPQGGKIRLGFMSSDLRRHPVGYFALPLFEHLDQQRFEVFCYSFYQGQEDDIQRFMTSKVAAYRWTPEIGSRAAAQMIADDQLDMLIELGGSTYMNKLDVMAYRPAPKQASWLGYPHSAGLSTIDYLICDPHNTPPRRDLLVEQPLLMPKSWIALGRMVFSEHHAIEPGLPEDRTGFVTFGTANNPHKYNREMLAAWAEVLNAVPNSRFMFIRPEGGTASFRANLVAEFARHGVAEERIIFRAVRGRHIPHYNEVDITLDTFPLTGGTTTTEALWMGVPVVSLVGEAFFERLSGSILANAGVADLATTDRARFLEIATALAADRGRRLDLRQSLRERMSSGPLGQTEQFARDFYDLIEGAVRSGQPAAQARV